MKVEETDEDEDEKSVAEGRKCIILLNVAIGEIEFDPQFDPKFDPQFDLMLDPPLDERNSRYVYFSIQFLTGFPTDFSRFNPMETFSVVLLETQLQFPCSKLYFQPTTPKKNLYFMRVNTLYL